MRNSKTIFSFFLMLCFINVAFAEDANKGFISGQLMIKGGPPLAGGQVFIFNDASGPPPSQVNYWRVPDYIVQIDERGKFSIGLSAGKYYLGAIKRVSGEKIGPPEDGDFFFASADEHGLPKPYVVRNGEKIELGVVSEAVPFKKRAVMAGTAITAIEGRISNAEGEAVAGALVLAQLVPLNMGRRPLFTSERTGKDGHYILRVHDAGKYYLRVRSMHDKGNPAAGEMIGAYGGKEPLAVVIEKGQNIKGIDITVVPYKGRESEAGQSAGRSSSQQGDKMSN